MPPSTKSKILFRAASNQNIGRGRHPECNTKKLELSSFKTLRGVRFGSLKLFFGESISKFCMQSGNARLYTLRYNVTNVTLCAQYSVTI